jgi:sulfur carrier protein
MDKTDLRVNGEAAALVARLADLLAQRGVTTARGTAVAVNGAVVPARAWGEIELHPGDEIEIVRPFGGG